MKNRSRIISLLTALVLILGVFWLSAAPAEEQSSRHILSAKRVRTSLVEPAHGAHQVAFSGTLRASKRAELGFTLPGRIVQRPVTIGQTVAAGDLLAQLDTLPLKNALAAAQAQLAQVNAQQQQANRDLKRVQALHDNKAATIEELEGRRAALETLQAQSLAATTAAEEAQRQLNEASLRAPFDAVVAEAYRQTGEFANPGAPIFSLIGSKELELEIEVPESIYAQLKTGETVQIELPFEQDRQLEGKLREKAFSNGRPGRLFPILIDVYGNANPGQTARLQLQLPSTGRMVVPIASVLNPGGAKPSVFVIKGAKAYRVNVSIGRLNGDLVEVSGDLQHGDRVAVSGFFGLLDGDAVEVIQ